jgi:hypothetical protein
MSDPSRTLASTILTGFPDHLQAIGLVTTQWSLLEDEMAVFLGVLIGNERAGRAIIHSLGSFAAKQTVLTAACTVYIRDTTTLNRVKNTLDDAKDLASKRNELTHHVWALKYGADSQPWQIVRKPTGKVKERMVPKAVVDIIKIADEVDHLIERLARDRKAFLAAGPGGGRAG